MQHFGAVLFLIGIVVMIGMSALDGLFGMSTGVALTVGILIGGLVSFIGAYIVERTTYVDIIPDYMKRMTDGLSADEVAMIVKSEVETDRPYNLADIPERV